jgi:hypothetical protein
MFPQEIIIKILEYDGRIKYRNGKFTDQITIDDKYEKIIKLINVKYFYQQKIKLYSINHFYIEIVLTRRPKKIGVIFDYYYYGRVYMFSFYKDIRNTYWYKFLDVFYKYFRIYHPDYFIKNYIIT